MVRTKAARVAVAVAALVLGGASAGAQTIDTQTGYGFRQYAFGLFTAVGQSFTATASNGVIQTASLFVSSAGGTVSYVARLQQFSGQANAGFNTPGSVVGPVLYTSATQSIGASTATRVDFNLGGIALTPGTLYVFYLSRTAGSGLQAYGPDQGTPFPRNDYTGGDAVTGTAADGTPTSSAGYDGGFVATFTPSIAAVPEPATVLLVGAGLVGFGAVARRRRTPAV